MTRASVAPITILTKHPKVSLYDPLVVKLVAHAWHLGRVGEPANLYPPDWLEKLICRKERVGSWMIQCTW